MMADDSRLDLLSLQGELPSFAVIATVLSGTRFSFPTLYRSLQRVKRGDWHLFVVGPEVDGTQFAADPNVTAVRTEPGFAPSVDAALAIMDATYVMVAQDDGEISPAIFEGIAETLDGGQADLIYADECVIRNRGKQIVFKPDFSPERLRCQFYLGNPVFYRTELVRKLGGLSSDYPGAEMYDLALRVAREKPQVLHLRHVMFTAPKGTPQPGSITDARGLESVRQVLSEHLEATGGGYVSAVDKSGVHQTHRSVIGEPLVSIIIPTRGTFDTFGGAARSLVVDCVRSIVELSTYTNIELVVVIDAIADPEVVASLTEIGGDRLTLVWWDQPFNFSAKVNAGVFHARGDYVLFLNDDTKVIAPRWIEPMLALCQLPGAGMAGAMLYFEDDSIQHAGHLYEAGDAGHIGTNDVRGSAGPFGSYRVEREISGVTAACSLMPRAVFEAVGGFSLLLPGNFNDVDLCMKVTQLGYQIYWTPFSELYHYESKTRISRVARYEVDTAWGRWEWRMDDPTYWPYGMLATIEEEATAE